MFIPPSLPLSLPPPPHTHRVQMLPGVMVKELALSVISSDDSYMPKLLTVSVGNTENSLREVKKLTVPRETNGKFMLVRNLSTEYRFIQINIRGCYNEGCDVKIRGLHIKGCKYVQVTAPGHCASCDCFPIDSQRR